MSAKKIKILGHIGFWMGIYLLWILLFHRYSVALSRTMTIEFCYLFFITADYYLINYFIIPAYLNKKKYGLFIITIIAVIAVSASLRTLVALEMNQHFFHTSVVPAFREIYVNSLLNISLWVLLITAGSMLIERIQTQRQLELLGKERIKSELDFLKAQINPHSLFNSLNTIYGHIDKSNQKARNILLQFSELLRYQLYDCTADKVPLEREIEYAHNYIDFQRLRKSEQLRVDLRTDLRESGLQIAPLMLVVLIENAFKFVSEFSDRENKICIQLFTKEGMLHAIVLNTRELIQSADSGQPGGIGLFNLKRRLELLYPGKYALTIQEDEMVYETRLKIDLK